MDESEIKKKLAEMQAMLKPIQKGETTIHTEATPAPKVLPGKKPKTFAPPVEVPMTPPEVPGAPCFNAGFKYLIDSLDPEFIGKNHGKDMLMDVLGTVPTCPEGVTV